MASGYPARGGESGGHGKADASEARRIAALQRVAVDAAAKRRRVPVPTSAPSSSESAEAVALHKDFLNIVDTQTAGAVEVEIVRNDDRGMRFYTPTLPYVVATEAGDPVRTIGASSTAEATLCSLTIPANSLGTSGKAILELVGDITNNSGGGNTFRPRVKLGSTTVYDKATSLVTNSNPRPFVWRVHVCARGATNKQRVTTEILNGRPLAGSSGSGDWGEFTGYHFTAQGDAAENSTSSLAVAVTMQNDVSNANIYCRLYSAKLIAIP